MEALFLRDSDGVRIGCLRPRRLRKHCATFLDAGKDRSVSTTIWRRRTAQEPLREDESGRYKGRGEKERCRDDRQALRSVPRGTWGTDRIACATGRQRRRPEGSGGRSEGAKEKGDQKWDNLQFW